MIVFGSLLWCECFVMKWIDWVWLWCVRDIFSLVVIVDVVVMFGIIVVGIFLFDRCLSFFLFWLKIIGLFDFS